MTQGDLLEQDLSTECERCMASWRDRWANDPGTSERRAVFAYALGIEHWRWHR